MVTVFNAARLLDGVGKMTDDVIRATVQVIKVQTLQAGGWRITLDGTDMQAFSEFAKAQMPGILLELAAVAVKVDNDGTTDESRKIHI